MPKLGRFMDLNQRLQLMEKQKLLDNPTTILTLHFKNVAEHHSPTTHGYGKNLACVSEPLQ
jgi:hypothetical protein